MANKRQLKKNISRVCGALATDLILASYAVPGIERSKVNELLIQIAALQSDARAKASFVFDKSAKDFESERAYNQAHQAYNRAAFAKLGEEFAEAVNGIIKEMNALIPVEARKAVAQ